MGSIITSFLFLASSICYATGDPHYLTFDDVWHDFQGDCEYTLVQECRDGTDSPFRVDVRNIGKEDNIYGSYTYEVTVQVFEVVSMIQGAFTMPGECFMKTKIDFKFDFTMAGSSCH